MRLLLLAMLLGVLPATNALAGDFATCSQDANINLKLAGCTRLIAVQPTLAAAYSSRGDAFSTLGRVSEAIGDYSRAIELDPRLGVAIYNRGLAYLAGGNAQAALIDFDAAIAINAGDARAFNGRGMANAALGALDAADADFGKAIQLDPDYARAYLSRATLSLRRRRFDDANVDFDAVLRLHFGDPEALAGRLIADSKGELLDTEVTSSATKLTAVAGSAAGNEAAQLHSTALRKKHRQPETPPETQLQIVLSR